jgi:sec-independent protein translocase protein TatA
MSAGHVGLEYTEVLFLGRPHSAFRGGGGSMFEGLFQPMHLLVILVIALIIFGPRRLPELGKGIGEGIRALKNGMKDQENKEKAQTTAENKPENQPEHKA